MTPHLPPQCLRCACYAPLRHAAPLVSVCLSSTCVAFGAWQDSLWAGLFAFGLVLSLLLLALVLGDTAVAVLQRHGKEAS